MQFDATETLGALAKLPPETPKPVEQGTTAGGIWRAARNAVPAAVAESAAMVAKGASIAFDDSPDNRGPVRQFGEEVERSLRNVAESYAPDPMTASKAEQTVFGLTRGVGKAVGYGLTTGPAAPLLFGIDEGLTEREKLIRQGVDEQTAGRVGMVAGAVNTLGFAIPVAGSTVARTVGLAALSGPASFVAQQSASREILRAADYESIASTYDPTDALGLALSAIPFGFGAWAMRGRFKTAKPATEAAPVAPDAIPVEPMRAADESGVSPHIVQATPDVAVRSPDIAPARVAEESSVTAPVVRQEHVDAAMVKNLVEASEFMRVMESPPMESLEAFAARTIPPEAPTPKAGKDPFLAWLKRQGGVNIQDKYDITGEANPIRLNRGAVFNKRGIGVDDLAIIAESEGWLPPGATADIDGGVPQLKEMIRRAMAGDSIKPLETIYGDIEAQHRLEADALMAEELSRRLEILGVDPKPARGNVDVLAAYLEQHEPRLLRQRLAEVGTIDDYDLPAPTPKETTADVPTPEKLGAQEGEAPAAQGKAEGVQIPEGTGPDAAVIQSVRTRADQVVLETPDLVVGVDENGATITSKQALEKIRREAQEGTENDLGANDAPLIDVAIQCALSVGQ